MKNILITGGELFNKGAQSMTFITVNELKRRFQNHEVILISGRDYKRSEEEKNQYNFRICYDVFKYLYGYGIYSKLKRVDNKLIKESKRILENTDFLVDISGYALGSDWSINSTLYYVSKIRTAKKYGVKVYLMPQSFGPFNYSRIIRPFVNIMINNSLQLASLIYAREKEGFDLLTKKLGLNNVKLSQDLVLQNEDIDIKNIYKGNPTIRDIQIKQNSVAIIPNMKNFKHGNKNEVVELYRQAVNKLLDLNKQVYLIRHSFEDIEACEIIKSKFDGNNSVILLGDDYSCLEYEEMVKKFDYLIASRYHSIVHAYREGVPCIALGWATKYHELLGRFNQADYIFDVRKNIDYDKFLNKIVEINDNWSVDSQKILEELQEVRRMNVFKNSFE